MKSALQSNIWKEDMIDASPGNRHNTLEKMKDSIPSPGSKSHRIPPTAAQLNGKEDAKEPIDWESFYEIPQNS